MTPLAINSPSAQTTGTLPIRLIEDDEENNLAP